jgi:hypothetical protein
MATPATTRRIDKRFLPVTAGSITRWRAIEVNNLADATEGVVTFFTRRDEGDKN